MPKGKGKSKGAKKGPPPQRKLELIEDEGQYYGMVTKIWGHGKVQVSYVGPSKGRDNDSFSEIRANVPIRKRQKKLRVEVGGYVVISIREYQMDVADVIHTYREDENAVLKRKGVLSRELLGHSDMGDNIVVFDGSEEEGSEEGGSEEGGSEEEGSEEGGSEEEGSE